MRVQYPDLIANGLNYTSVAFSALRRLPVGLRAQLHQNGRWQDVVAWVFVAALESYRAGADLKATYNAAQRRIYWALKAEGYVREYRNGRLGNYIRPETPFRAYETEERGFLGKTEERGR